MEASRNNRYIRHIVSLPFIYIMFFPMLILDLFVEIYHHICFSLYSIEYVKRSEYIKIDRHKLSYLNVFEKINCMYCGYANGLAHYLTEIAARTEKYWCGIKHASDPNFNPPEHHKDFLPYGDKQAYKNFIGK